MTAIQAKVFRERIRWRGTRDTLILESQTDEKITIKVKEEDYDRIRPGRHYVFWGRWGRYQGERQFQADTYASPQEAPWMDAVKTMTDGRKFPLNISKTAVHEWHEEAATVIRGNPFELLRFPRCGFKICDALYLHLGHPPDALIRQLLCGVYELETNGDGSIWHRRRVFDQAIRLSIQGHEPKCQEALQMGLDDGHLAREFADKHGQIDWDGNYEWLATFAEADHEFYIARHVVDALNEKPGWPEFAMKDMTAHQFAHLKASTTKNIGALCGGGGVGKTFVVAELIQTLLSIKTRPDRICLVAPTGRAAVRMTESLRNLGLKDPALRGRTIHSALGWAASGFAHNRGNPLQADFIIADEMSMCDQSLMYSLLQARADGCPILLVGDPYQLPPVGAGAPLRDLLWHIPVGMLTETHRNAGTVAKTAAAIRHGKDWIPDLHLEIEAGANHVHHHAESKPQVLGALDGVLAALSQQFEIDPIWDIQVIGIINKKSELSVSTLNEILQQRLNPSGRQVEDCIFREKDKVINTSNGWLLPDKKLDVIAPEAVTNPNGEVYVANGELGQVLVIHDKYMTVRMTDPERIVMVPLKGVQEGSEEGQTGSNFQLGYAITTHKSQGSQFPYVIAIIDDSGGARRLADRSLWYTMITRTSKACITIGKKDVIVNASKRCAIEKRKTFLKERIEALL